MASTKGERDGKGRARRQPLRVVDPSEAELPGASAVRPRRARAASGNLPETLSSFVGRTDDIEELDRLLGASRLVTLTGPGGVGKTRLALELATRVASSYSHGAWLVDLAAVDDAVLVPQAVATALGIRPADSVTVEQGLVRRLRSRRLLLVMDNCEHLIAACAQLVQTLLEGCAQVSIMATSREPLTITGETAWSVSPLAAPHPEAATSSEAMTAYGAVQLFVDRATAVDRSFGLDAETAPAVAEICRRLDGLPLAIELAAARVSVVPVQRIAERLDDRFQLLSRGSRAAPRRHQTLRAAVEWSYELLSPAEQVLFRRLSVFSGSWSLEAAVEICGGEDAEHPGQARLFDLLAGLIEKSMVITDSQGPEPRYRMLETIRQFAAERARDAGEDQAVQGRHAAWYAALAQRAVSEAAAPDYQTWTERLRAEHDNLRAALESSLATGQGEQATHLAIALGILWTRLGHLGQGRKWLDTVLARAEGVPVDLRGQVLRRAGYAAFMVGDLAAAAPALEESVALSTGAAKAEALRLLGTVRLFSDDPSAALPLLEQSIRMAADTAGRATLITSLATCGRAHLFLGDVKSARVALEQSLSEASATGEQLAVVPGLIGMGWTEMLEGNHRQAARLLDEALAACGDVHTYDKALALSLLGELAALRGDAATSRKMFEESLRLARLMDTPFPTARSLLGLGRLALHEGDSQHARALFEEAVSVGRKHQIAYIVVRGLQGLGEVAEAAGQTTAARAWFEEALVLATEKADRPGLAASLLAKGLMAHADGDDEGASQLLHESLAMFDDIGDPVALALALDMVAVLAAAEGRPAVALRLWGSVESYRQAAGVAPGSPVERARREEAMARARRALSKEEFEAAWAEGSDLALHKAVSYARRGRGSRHRAVSGWTSLTGAERDVAELVQEGLTNREIAERLFLSPRTVQWHLSAVFRKLGLKSRVELTREAFLHSK